MGWPDYKPVTSQIMNAYNGLPAWLTAMPSVDINAAIKDEEATRQLQRQEQEAQAVGDFFKQNPEATIDNSSDELQGITGGFGDLAGTMSLSNHEATKSTKDLAEREKFLKGLPMLAAISPEVAQRKLMDMYGLATPPDLAKLEIGREEKIDKGNYVSVTKYADGTTSAISKPVPGYVDTRKSGGSSGNVNRIPVTNPETGKVEWVNPRDEAALRGKLPITQGGQSLDSILNKGSEKGGMDVSGFFSSIPEYISKLTGGGAKPAAPTDNKVIPVKRIK